MKTSDTTSATGRIITIPSYNVEVSRSGLVLKVMFNGGAAPLITVWDWPNRLAEAELDQRVHICAGYGAIETKPGATNVHYEAAHAGVIGLPIPGVTLKLTHAGIRTNTNCACKARMSYQVTGGATI